MPSHAPAVLMHNAKSLRGELASVTQRFTLEDAQKVTIPTLLVKGELSPKFLHQIALLASCMPNSQELIIPAESHNLGLEKPQVFNNSRSWLVATSQAGAVILASWCWKCCSKSAPGERCCSCKHRWRVMASIALTVMP